MSRRQIDLPEVIQGFGERLKSSMYFSFPGIVKAYYSDGTADVQPAVNDVRFDVDTGEQITEPFPVIPKVRILYPSAPGYSITWPLAVGAKVTLEAYDLDPTKHRLTGNVEDPIDVRRHGGGYWRCRPEDITDGAPTATAGQITIDGPGITLGAGATDYVALASLVKNEFASFALWVKTGTYIPYPGGSPGSPVPLVFSSAAPSDSVASTVVKCK